MFQSETKSWKKKNRARVYCDSWKYVSLVKRQLTRFLFKPVSNRRFLVGQISANFGNAYHLGSCLILTSRKSMWTSKLSLSDFCFVIWQNFNLHSFELFIRCILPLLLKILNNYYLKNKTNLIQVVWNNMFTMKTKVHS